ncbi:GNAT family N-acetyltransferase [Anaeromicropila herbilytica]|uniref:N-acetyltransferase domain-containing protein n=1 Tax=Anaeromicropila herbilytica TaxID=2785025 RepID=A0A7R7ELB2_9FIRM|nr:GNAT family N-acetyltransferase [Anaeromicropila herbilytica]BCN30894.1 hypothetical protein bsdtb5_21890 [Anaeromicropila herbilytica]
MEIRFGKYEDLDSWMQLVKKVSWNFPGLETDDAIEEHKNTVLKFMNRTSAICAIENNQIVGVLLFSNKNNMLCCMAVDPDYRRNSIATKMFSFMITTIADTSKDIVVSTFREGDPKGVAPRAFYKKIGFVEGELTEEFGYPNQKFILKVMKKPKIIAIAAVSGGGKTTIVNELHKRLSLSKAIYFDDYDFEKYPEDFYEWVKNGADYNEWNLGKMVRDINDILAHEQLNYILLDYPFAYKNDMVTPYIDYSIFINTPLDIAMARRIVRDYVSNQSPERLNAELNYYLLHGRIAYLEMLNTVMPDSDYIIDGSLSIEEIVTKILEKIE